MAEHRKNVSAVLIFFSLILFGVGAFKAAHVFQFESQAKRTIGVVAENEQEILEGGRVNYIPVFTFTDMTGHVIRLDNKIANSYLRRYSPGDNIEIFYLESAPQQTAVVGGIEPWVSALWFVHWGALLLLAEYGLRTGIISSNMNILTYKYSPAGIVYRFAAKAYRSHINKRNSK